MHSPRQQVGMVLVTSLIMLVVLTLLALSSVNSANNNIRIAGNMQVQEEVQLAAQIAIEQQLSNLSNFTTPGSPASIAVDINQDGVADYTVTLGTPKCINAKQETGYSSTLTGSSPNTTYWVTQATVVTDARTGASAIVQQGVRIGLLPHQGC